MKETSDDEDDWSEDLPPTLTSLPGTEYSQRQWSYAKAISEAYRDLEIPNAESASDFFEKASTQRYHVARASEDCHSDDYLDIDFELGLGSNWQLRKRDSVVFEFPRYSLCDSLVCETLSRAQEGETTGIELEKDGGSYFLTYQGEDKLYRFTSVQRHSFAGPLGISRDVSKWSTAWVHPSREEAVEGWKEVEKLHAQLVEGKEKLSSGEVRTLALTAYWLACNNLLTRRGHGQNSWAYLTKMLDYHGFPQPRASRKHGTADTVAITVPLHCFLEMADEVIEGLPPADAVRESRMASSSSAAATAT